MWIFSIISEQTIHFTLIVGIVFLLISLVLSFIPLINRYRIPIQVLSVCILCFAIYLEGGLAENKEWRAKVKELEIKLAKAEKESLRLNIELQAALENKGEVIREKGETIIKYIDRYKTRDVLRTVTGPERIRIEEVIRYIEKCPIPKELIDIHNKAATLDETTNK